jgi:hypothetical protein
MIGFQRLTGDFSYGKAYDKKIHAQFRNKDILVDFSRSFVAEIDNRTYYTFAYKTGIKNEH